MAWIAAADNPDNTVALDDPATAAHRFYWRANLHGDLVPGWSSPGSAKAWKRTNPDKRHRSPSRRTNC